MNNNNFKQATYTTLFQQIDKAVVTLEPGGAAQLAATFNTTPISCLTVTLGVAVSPLSDLEVWVRGDKYGSWFQLTLDQLLGYGRTDDDVDPTTTPAGAACFVMLDCAGWSDVRIKVVSPGAAQLTITAGGK